MSEKIKYQFSAIPADWLTSSKITAQEKIILGVLILKSSNGLYKYGYEELAKYACISRRQCIYLTEHLINLGYIRKQTGVRPVVLEVRLDTLGGDCQDVPEKSAIDCTLFGNPESKKECNLKQERVQFKAKKSAVDCTHNRYIDLNLETRACAREEKATADVAAVRSIADHESAKMEYAENQCELEDFLLADSFFNAFEDFKPWATIEKNQIYPAVNTSFGYQKFNDLFDEKRAAIDNFFAEKNQKITVFCEKSSKKRKIIVKSL